MDFYLDNGIIRAKDGSWCNPANPVELELFAALAAATTPPQDRPAPYGWLLDGPPYFQREPLTQMQGLAFSTMPVYLERGNAVLLTALGRLAACTAAKDAEIERLQAALTDKVMRDTMLTGMAVRDGSMDIGFQGGAASLLAEMLAQQFKDGGGINYIELSFVSSAAIPGEKFVVTVQRCEGKTPHYLRTEAEANAAALAKRVAEMEALLSRAMFAMEEWQIAHTLRGEILGALPPTQGGAG